MLVDPLTPRIEILGPALLGDGLERPDLHPVVQRDRNGPDFTRVGVGVLQNRVAPALAILAILNEVRTLRIS